MTSSLMGGKGEAAGLEKIIKACVETRGGWGLMENDIVFAVAFWSMAECGFRSVAEEESRAPVKERSETSLPRDWKHETRKVYEAQFVLPPHPECPVKLVALPADDILCINVLAANVSPKNISLRSLAIHSGGCVPRPDEDPAIEFSGLKDFHLLLRDVIIWPIRCSILTDCGVLNGSLCGLSDEMKLRIVRHLTVKETLVLSETCHELNRICNDQGLWKGFFHEHFPSRCGCLGDGEECEEVADWKENFKEAFLGKRRSRGSLQNSGTESYRTAPEGTYGSEIDLGVD